MQVRHLPNRDRRDGSVTTLKCASTHGCIPLPVHRPKLATCARVDHGLRPCSGKAHRDCLPAPDRTYERPRLCEASSYTEGHRDPQALFCTDVTLQPAEIVAFFVRRWQVEVTFAEARAHLGVETQRQCSDKAIARTTPLLLGLYSLITLWATDLLTSASCAYAAAWYRETHLTFSDAIGTVRFSLRLGDMSSHSPQHRERDKIPQTASSEWHKHDASRRSAKKCTKSG